ERKQQLMQPSEGKPRLRRRSRRRHYRRALPEGPFPDSFEQRRLTDSSLATDNEGTATPPDPIDHSEEALQLPISPQEQPSGGTYILRISTGSRHAHPPPPRSAATAAAPCSSASDNCARSPPTGSRA